MCKGDGGVALRSNKSAWPCAMSHNTPDAFPGPHGAARACFVTRPSRLLPSLPGEQSVGGLPERLNTSKNCACCGKDAAVLEGAGGLKPGGALNRRQKALVKLGRGCQEAEECDEARVDGALPPPRSSARTEDRSWSSRCSSRTRRCVGTRRSLSPCHGAAWPGRPPAGCRTCRARSR